MNERPIWRRVDTGLRPAAENIALNRAMLECHSAGQIPNTLRFLRFEPSALLGFHQCAGQELRLDYCRQHEIAVQRRVTGGGAIYFDPLQIGWELYLDRRALGTADMDAIARRICTAAARGISRLGVQAEFRPRNDIEVAGRKISGTGGAFDGDSLLYQGTLLLDLDAQRMVRVLRVPSEKIADKAISSLRERVTTLRELLGGIPPLSEVYAALAAGLGEGLGVRFEAAELTPAEHEAFEVALAEIDSEAWVNGVELPPADASMAEGVHRTPGGLIRVRMRFDSLRAQIRQVWITGDFFIEPGRSVPDLEAALKDLPLERMEAAVHRFFAEHPARMLALSPEDFVAALRAALAGVGDIGAGIPQTG